MKTFKWLVALFAFALVACDSDDENIDKAQPSAQTKAAFNKEFPNATNVSWSRKGGYEIASFTLTPSRANATAQSQNKAWYIENSGKCAYINLELTWAQLQTEAPAVATAWENSNYKQGGYTLDDIRRREYSDGSESTYKLEIEKGDVEYELVYQKDGTLLSERLDNDANDEDDEDDPAPLEILNFIATSLPDAVVLDSESETENNVTYYEVEILYPRGNVKVEYSLMFDTNFALGLIAEEIEEEDYTDTSILPAVVYAKFQELAAGKSIDELCKAFTNINDFKNNANFIYVGIIEYEDSNDVEHEDVYFVNAKGEVITI